MLGLIVYNLIGLLKNLKWIPVILVLILTNILGISPDYFAATLLSFFGIASILIS